MEAIKKYTKIDERAVSFDPELTVLELLLFSFEYNLFSTSVY
jgi:hypothetical protein